MNWSALLSLMLTVVQSWPCSPSTQNCGTQNTDQSFTAVRRVKRAWVWEPLFATEEQTSVVPVYVGQVWYVMIQEWYKVRYNMLISSLLTWLGRPNISRDLEVPRKVGKGAQQAVFRQQNISYFLWPDKVRQLQHLAVMSVPRTFHHLILLSMKLYIHSATKTSSIHSRWRYQAEKFFSVFWMKVKDSFINIWQFACAIFGSASKYPYWVQCSLQTVFSMIFYCTK